MIVTALFARPRGCLRSLFFPVLVILAFYCLFDTCLYTQNRVFIHVSDLYSVCTTNEYAVVIEYYL